MSQVIQEFTTESFETEIKSRPVQRIEYNSQILLGIRVSKVEHKQDCRTAKNTRIINIYAIIFHSNIENRIGEDTIATR